MTPQEVLAKAAEIMSRRGKATGTYECAQDDPHYGAKGSVCAYGAMSLAATGEEYAMFSELEVWRGKSGVEQKELVNQAAKLLARQVGRKSGFLTDFSTVTRFNDNSSGEDVILAMKKAAHG